MVNGSISKPAFSLVELVIVVVIIGIVAAVAVPRFSRGASGAGAAALCGDLRTLRTAIERYAGDHGGTFPERNTFDEQLTQYTGANGNTNPIRMSPYVYGPYLYRIPALPVGDGPANGKGKNKVHHLANASTGWIYDENTGLIRANSGTAADDKGTLFSQY